MSIKKKQYTPMIARYTFRSIYRFLYTRAELSEIWSVEKQIREYIFYVLESKWKLQFCSVGTMKKRRKTTKFKAVRCCIWYLHWEEVAYTTFFVYERSFERISKNYEINTGGKKRRNTMLIVGVRSSHREDKILVLRLSD